MILVTLGTQDKKFTRLLEAIQKQIDKGNIKDKVIVQAGCTKYESKDMEILDLLHYIEIHTLKSYDLAKAAKLLQDLRRERRQIKYNIEVIEIFKRFADKYNNKLITGDIMQVLKDKNKKDKVQEKPIYKYKTDVLKRIGIETEEDL